MNSRKSRSPRDAALGVLKELVAAGHTAYFAGGCVRDMLLCRAPKDFDLATSATPDQVHVQFPRSRRVGAQFGVMLVRRHGHDIEVATFRSDGAYLDGRHPEEVSFGTEEQDAMRRDFTINGMFHDPLEDRIIDHVGGQADVEGRIIRTIGVPGERFGEDHLRMLRAVRFATQLGFTIHQPTLAAIRKSAARLHLISAERVWMELSQILAAPRRAEGVQLLVQSELGDHLVASWSLRAEADSAEMQRLDALPKEPIPATLALAALTASLPASELNRVFRALKLSNLDRDETVWLVESLPLAGEGETIELADLKELAWHGRWTDLLRLVRADEATVEGRPGTSDSLEDRVARIPQELLEPSPFVSGEDLLQLGMEQGPAFGELLRKVYRAQLNEEIATREEAMQMVRSTRTAPPP